MYIKKKQIISVAVDRRRILKKYPQHKRQKVCAKTSVGDDFSTERYGEVRRQGFFWDTISAFTMSNRKSKSIEKLQFGWLETIRNSYLSGVDSKPSALTTD